jgi:hypothetical protein
MVMMGSSIRTDGEDVQQVKDENVGGWSALGS